MTIAFRLKRGSAACKVSLAHSLWPFGDSRSGLRSASAVPLRSSSPPSPVTEPRRHKSSHSMMILTCLLSPDSQRCRRLRSKCIHGSPNKSPCEGCLEAGPVQAAECAFPARGEDSGDRDFRRKRIKNAEKVGQSSRSPASGVGGSPGGAGTVARRTGWDSLPPIEEG